jgi:peptide/nickel transport system substrate-binding protein
MDPEEPWLLGIGEVAHRSGLSVSALHFYERTGLLPAPERLSGRRRYDPRVLNRLGFIDMAKRAGFSLSEVAELLDGFDEAVPATERWRLLAARKLPEVEALIEQAGAMKTLLQQGLACECLRLDNQTLFVSSRRSWYPSPFAYERGPGLVHAHLLFDTLLWKDASGRLMPWLATEWEGADDATAWRFRLHPEARWHDGRRLTAADVVFTFHYLTTGPGRTCPGLQWGLDVVADVLAESPDVVVFRLHRRYEPFEEWVAGRMIITPEHIWSQVAEPARLRGAGAVMGSGPYRLAAHHEGTSEYVYVANLDHFLGVPHVRRLELVEVPDPLLALLRGEVDIASGGGERELDEDARHALQDPRYSKITGPGEWARALHLNLARGFPYDDVRFRRAVVHAIDRDELVRRILGGAGTSGSMGGMAPSHPDVPTDLATYPHDVRRAGHLLDEIGLRQAHGARWRRRPDGSPFVPELQVPSDADPEVARLVAGDLRRVGIDLRVSALDAAEADLAATEGSYEMALLGYGSLGGDPDWLRIRLSPSVRVRTPARVHGYHNASFEALAARQVGVADPDERRRLVQQMQRLVAHDVPFVHLYVPERADYFDRQVFDAWYFTPGGVAGAYPGPLNKHAFLTGRRTEA